MTNEALFFRTAEATRIGIIQMMFPFIAASS